MPGDPVLSHPLYQKYSNQAVGDIAGGDVCVDILKAMASNESASVISYLCWVVRVIEISQLF